MQCQSVNNPCQGIPEACPTHGQKSWDIVGLSNCRNNPKSNASSQAVMVQHRNAKFAPLNSWWPFDIETLRPESD